jgi:glycosyltransferase involved in cell wall biosynthesis
MWEMTLPPRLAKVGRTIEFRLAPPFYRRTDIVTLSESSKRELVEKLGLKPKRIHVVPVGIDATYSPGGERSPVPLVVAVGRLVAVKRFSVLVDALVEAKRSVPELHAVIVGDGYEREELRARIEAAGATEWLTLAGRVSDAEKIDLYRRAWLVASASAHEGWGMTLTEAAACGTPAVATRIAGHEDAVADGVSGLLSDRDEQIAPLMVEVLTDDARRASLSAGALEHAAQFSWESTALRTYEVLVAGVHRRRP